MLKEFKEFAFKGNVIDLAIGVIIGGAFGKIVSSLVNDMLMPLLGLLLNGVNLKDLKYVITPATDTVAEVAILYGSFMQTVVDFLIIAFSIFLFIKLISRKKKETVPAAPPEPAQDILLLTEIRDLLKENACDANGKKE